MQKAMEKTVQRNTERGSYRGLLSVLQRARGSWPWALSGSLLAICLLLSGPPVVAESEAIPWSEVQKHAGPSSCWIVIDNQVYDITIYLAEHSTKHSFSLSPFCGKDATSGWNDKNGKGKPHSRKASIQLKRFHIGVLQ